MMNGRHERLREARPGELYVATIDPAGADANAGGALDNPHRDFTVATLFRLVWPDDPDTAAPAYEAVDVFTDQGSRHFQSEPGRASLAERLLAYLRRWNPAHTLIDAAGVGQGLADWLAERLGRGAVTAWPLGSATAKARLGSDFLSLIDTGRFRYWSGDEDEPLSDGWWFWQQVVACGYSLAESGRFDRDLRWGVAESARIDTPAGPQRVHDDRLLSAALVAEIERRRAAGRLVLGASASRVVGPGAFWP